MEKIKKFFTIALIGQKNVGKSTIFNKLTNTNEALISKTPGLTKDRKYGKYLFKNTLFSIIDTGGLDNTNEKINHKIKQQTIIAIKESDVILLITDINIGITNIEQSIAKYLHKNNKNTFLIINKIDNYNFSYIPKEYHALGIKNIHPISAIHKKGIKKLIKNINTNYKKNINKQKILKRNLKIYFKNQNKIKIKNYQNKEKITTISIVGKQNAGKSTLINKITKKNRVIVSNIPGTTTDNIHIPVTKNGSKYIFVDTAGMQNIKKNYRQTTKKIIDNTLNQIKNSNIIFLLIDAKLGISKKDLFMLSFTLKYKLPIILIINKFDTILNKEKKYLKQKIYQKLSFIKFTKIYFISALNDKKFNFLFKIIEKINQQLNITIKNNFLTKILKIAISKCKPPLHNNKKPKINHVHRKNKNTLTFKVYGKHISKLPLSYKRYLIKYLHNKLNLKFTPIYLQFYEKITKSIN